MYPTRSRVFLLSVLMLASGSAFAQRPGPEFRRPLACEPLEPRTKLEAVEGRYEKVLIKGFTQVAALNARGGEVRVDAVELKEDGSSTRALGIIVAVREAGEKPRDNRAFVDYEEIESLIKAIESIARINETVTKLTGFEARYRTPGDLDLNVFRQSRSGTAASLTSGICEKTTVLLSLDELERFKGIILEAKTRLDEIR
ncbi:MAG: hypothetical protein M3410_01140 [Acidobacteriota bacterium]|nr:hypothetical protein [Acidobacteriota bacterium]